MGLRRNQLREVPLPVAGQMQVLSHHRPARADTAPTSTGSACVCVYARVHVCACMCVFLVILTLVAGWTGSRETCTHAEDRVSVLGHPARHMPRRRQEGCLRPDLTPPPPPLRPRPKGTGSQEGNPHLSHSRPRSGTDPSPEAQGRHRARGLRQGLKCAVFRASPPRWKQPSSLFLLFSVMKQEDLQKVLEII